MNIFPLGTIVATPAALEAIKDSGQTPDFFLEQARSLAIGASCARRKRPNDQALSRRTVAVSLPHAEGRHDLDHQ